MIQIHNVLQVSRLPSKDLPSDIKSPWVKHSWDLACLAIDNADAVDLFGRNAFGCDDWAENEAKGLPVNDITIHVGHNMVELRKTSLDTVWMMRIVERSDYEENTHSGGGNFNKVLCISEGSIKSRKGRRSFEKKLAKFMIEKGRPWSEYAFYRQP
jgi:hypothetical protein